MNSSRVIPGPGSSAWQRWNAPSVLTEPSSTQESYNAKLPTEQELQALRESAFEEGFAAGRAQGIESGRAETENQARLFKDLMAALAQPFNDLDGRLEEELVALEIALVRQLVRREIRTDPEVVLAAVRESLRALPASSQDIRLVLHPDDATIVRRFLADDQQENNWRITENPGLSRGGCKVLTTTSRIDATVENRLASVISAVFGGERSTDRSNPAPTTEAESPSKGGD
jgi:flagellar assembly protein FliH